MSQCCEFASSTIAITVSGGTGRRVMLALYRLKCLINDGVGASMLSCKHRNSNSALLVSSVIRMAFSSFSGRNPTGPHSYGCDHLTIFIYSCTVWQEQQRIPSIYCRPLMCFFFTTGFQADQHVRTPVCGRHGLVFVVCKSGYVDLIPTFCHIAVDICQLEVYCCLTTARM